MNVAKPDRSKAHPTATPDYFEGGVHMQPLLTSEVSQELELIAVFFEDGARTIVHAHSTDQVLWVVEGTCIVADGSAQRELRPGECVLVPAGRWHWHGAAPGGSMCHISIRRPGPTDWGVPRRGITRSSPA